MSEVKSANVFSNNKHCFITSSGRALRLPVHLLKKQNKKIMKMKSLIISMLVVFSAGIAFAGEDEPRTGFAVVSVKGSGVYKVIYKSESAGKVKLNIYDATGSVIFTETLYGVNGFMVPLNFGGLTAGEYTIELLGAEGRKAERVSHQPNSNVNRVHISKMANEESKYLLAVASTGSDVIYVRILDRNNNVIHSETKEINGDFAQVYKLAAPSAYTFEVTDKSGNTKSIKF
jgi:hypothetical protein